jgi:hypothetical protein
VALINNHPRRVRADVVTPPRRPADPNKNKSKLSADAVLIRCRADAIDEIADDLLRHAKRDETKDKIFKIKEKALGIVSIIEDHQ